MILLSNATEQTLQPGQSAVFGLVILHTGCAECYRINSGAVNLKASGALYEIKFNANVGTLTANDPVQLAIALENSPLLETTMISTPATATTADTPVLNNISAETIVKTCCCNGSDAVTIINTGENPVVIGVNPKLAIKRVA